MQAASRQVKRSRFTGARRAPGATPADAIGLLRSDFKTATALLEQLEDARSTSEKRALVRRLCVALSVHAQLGDELLLPALRKALRDPVLLSRVDGQQSALRSLVAEVQETEPLDADYAENLRLISEHLRHHLEEQDEMFPDAPPKTGTGALATQLADRKRQLLAELSEFGGWD